MEDNHFYNVALFVDYENVYKTLLKEYKNAIRLGFFDKIREWCKKNGRRIVKIAVYCNFDSKDLYESHHQSLLQSYGVESIHTSNQGKNYADLQIAIDVLNSMYTNNNIDEFIIMSNDKDMTPLLNTLRTNKRKASVLTTGCEYNKSLCEFADEQIKFEDVVSFEYNKKLVIEDIENIFYDNIVSFIGNALAVYKTNMEDHKYFSKHYNIEYFASKQSAYYQVMQYEIYNMIRNYHKENKILLYKTKVKSEEYTAILPIHLKEDFLSLGIINESSICKNFDIDLFVNKKYEEYFPKNC